MQELSLNPRLLLLRIPAPQVIVNGLRFSWDGRGKNQRTFPKKSASMPFMVNSRST